MVDHTFPNDFPGWVDFSRRDGAQLNEESILEQFPDPADSSRVRSRLYELNGRCHDDRYYLDVTGFISQIGFYSKSPHLTLEAMDLVLKYPHRINPEYSDLPGLRNREGLNLFSMMQIPHLLLVSRARSDDATPSEETVGGLLRIASSYDPSTLNCIVEKAHRAAEMGNDVLRRYVGIMGDPRVRQAIMKQPLYDLAVFNEEALRALRSQEGDLVLLEEMVRDPSVMEYTRRMAAFYDTADLAKVMNAIRQNAQSDEVKGAERVAVASCVSEVAARTLEISPVLSLVRVADSYQLTELEAIMDAIERTLKRTAEDISFEPEPPHRRSLEKERGVLAKVVDIVAGGFTNPIVKQIGPAVRRRPYEKTVGPWCLPGTDNPVYAEISAEWPNTQHMAESIIEVAMNTGGSYRAVEAVAKTIIADDSFEENKERIVMQAVRSGDPGAIEAVAELVIPIDTTLIGRKRSSCQPQSSGHRDVAAGLNDLTAITTDPAVIRKGTEILTRLQHSGAAFYAFQRAIHRFPDDPGVVVHIGDHILETGGDEARINQLFGSLFES